MNKEVFEELSLLEQLEYVNSKLMQGGTLTSISKDIGIGRTTLRRRADRKGYIFNKELNQYTIQDKNTEELQIQDNSNNFIEELQKECNSNNYESNDNNYENVMKVINEIERRLDEVYTYYSEHKNNNETIGLKINKFNGEAINRTYKLYAEVQEDFKKFCEDNKTYKVQDIVSQALVEFMGKYKK